MRLKRKGIYSSRKIIKDIYLKHTTITKKTSFHSKNCESIIVLLSGSLEVSLDKTYFFSRDNVFTQKASAIYLPPQTKITLNTQQFAEIAICKTYSDKKTSPLIIEPQDIKEEFRGKSCFKRKVYNILDENGPSDRLIVGETINFEGNWSSFPPHKHDENTHEEAKMEELYLFKIKPENGFGFQRIYTQDLSIDETMLIENNDIVLIPKGYHPVAVMPGHELYYLWVLVGDTKILKPNTQEQYRWLIE